MASNEDQTKCIKNLLLALEASIARNHALSRILSSRLGGIPTREYAQTLRETQGTTEAVFQTLQAQLNLENWQGILQTLEITLESLGEPKV